MSASSAQWVYSLLFQGARVQGPSQGLLKIWTEHPHWFLLNPRPFKIAWQIFQHFYNKVRNEFSPNLECVPQKMGLLGPQEVLEVFGGKSKSEAAKAFIFGTKRVPNEVNNWWKFGVDISTHFWDIQFWTFLFFKVPSLWYKIIFENYLYTAMRALWKIKMFKIEYLKSGLRYQHQIFTSC